MRLTHDFLVKEGANWLNKHAPNTKWRSAFVVTEFSCVGTNEIPDIFGLRASGTVLIEVKVNRNDFLSDKLKKGRDPYRPQLGNYRFYLVPSGLVDPDEIPLQWGLLVWNGKEVLVKKEPRYIEDASDRSVMHLYHSVLRRLIKFQVIDFKKPKLL